MDIYTDGFLANCYYNRDICMEGETLCIDKSAIVAAEPYGVLGSTIITNEINNAISKIVQEAYDTPKPWEQSKLLNLKRKIDL